LDIAHVGDQTDGLPPAAAKFKLDYDLRGGERFLGPVDRGGMNNDPGCRRNSRPMGEVFDVA
jgi:hypothetical protein